MRVLLVACLVAPLALSGCVAWRGSFARPADYADLPKDDPFLKVHMVTGDVYVLNGWVADDDGVTGFGVHYDDARQLRGRGKFTIDPIGIALLETNRPETVGTTSFAVMGVVTGASLLLTATCLANPKACFGSCPTFFVDTPTGEALVAEGFSHSVAAVMESRDVDALGVRSEGGVFDLRMTNEALETHMVRSLELLTVSLKPDQQAYRLGDEFVVTGAVQSATSCRSTADEGQGPRVVDCTKAVATRDQVEHKRLSNPDDLGVAERLDLRLPHPGQGEAVVVLQARNSLVTTYVFYQALAWMGMHAGEWMQRLEHAKKKEFSPLGRELRDVKLTLKTSNGWRDLGVYDEVGPIALDSAAFAISPELLATVSTDYLEVRLQGAQGAWRYDHVGVASVVRTDAGVTVPLATAQGPRSDALQRLLDPDVHLATSPGDVYELTFDLPAGHQAVFLASTGWYVEWMRHEWLKDEDPSKVIGMLRDPRGNLRRLAADYKRHEEDADRIFWESRIGRRP